MENYYMVLGIHPGASPEEIRRAYLRKVKEKHPDRFNDPKEKEEATKEFALITEAYRILSDPNQRQEFDKRLSPPCTKNVQEEQARHSFNYGLSLLEKNPFSALKYLKAAFELDPKPIYQSYYGLGLVYTHKYEQGLSLLKSAIEKFPGDARLYYNLGLAHLRKKDMEEAKRWFEECLEWDSNFQKAKEILAQISPKKVSFLGRLFKR